MGDKGGKKVKAKNEKQSNLKKEAEKELKKGKLPKSKEVKK